MCSTEAGRKGLVPAAYIRVIKTKPRDDPFASTDDAFGADDPFAGACRACTRYLACCYSCPDWTHAVEPLKRLRELHAGKTIKLLRSCSVFRLRWCCRAIWASGTGL